MRRQNYKPILFSTIMVKSILKGWKTQTRRIVKDKNILSKYPNVSKEELIQASKYKVGDILYVRETFTMNVDKLIYRADVCSKYDIPDGCVWNPSLFMPKIFSRIFLEITDIKIQYLSDISDDECEKEGIRYEKDGLENSKKYYWFYKHGDLRDSTVVDNPKTSFYSLWTLINGKDSWQENPLVWVYTFNVIDKPTDFLLNK